MKMREFVPPIFLDLLRRIYAKAHKAPLSKVYTSYEEAVLACGKAIFSDDEYARLIVLKTKMFRDALNAQPFLVLGQSQLLALTGILLSISDSPRNILRVLDVGGASGTQYFLLKKFLNNLIDDLEIHWHVVETEATAQASRELENDELHFFWSMSKAIEELGAVDLVHASSVLQCLPDPQKYLEEMVLCGSRFIYLGSIGLTLEKTKVIALHQASFELAGPRPSSLPTGIENRVYEVPFTFLPKEDFDEILKGKFKIEIQVDDRLGIFDVPGKSIVGYSILARNEH